MKTIGQTIAKFTDNYANEDSLLVAEKCIAISDGAGGSGVYADEWSACLISNLPTNVPITTFGDLDQWIDGLWENFYNEHEAKAREVDGMLLNKFYNEGSCATLVAAWNIDDNRCAWMAYGDSVVFHFDCTTQRLEHSFTRLADFEQSSFLISCKDPLIETRAKFGVFEIGISSVVFMASDALSHYLLMMYKLMRCNEYADELEEERNAGTLNSQLLMMAENMQISDYFAQILMPLIEASRNSETFTEHLKELHHKGVLDIDDYTFACMSTIDMVSFDNHPTNNIEPIQRNKGRNKSIKELMGRKHIKSRHANNIKRKFKK